MKKIDTLAKKESRSRSEMLREAVRRLTKDEETRKRQFSAIYASGRQINMPEDKAALLIDKVRAALLINK